MTTTTSTRSSVQESLALFEVTPKLQVRLSVLKDLLPDAQTALFFGKAYHLDYRQLSNLLLQLFQTTVIETLLGEGDQHSQSLQDYIVDVVPDHVLMGAGVLPSSFTAPTGHEFLPELWEQLEVEVASSIQELVDSLDGVLSLVQGKYGAMVFSQLAKLNKQRAGVIGTFEAQIKHPVVPNNLLIFDVSGSVSRPTAEKIIDEVVALAYKANASLAIVSDDTFLWDPGSFTRDDVMSVAQFSGTQYETLTSVLNRDWATVITVADYDSSRSAYDYIGNRAKGRIQQVLDISLVNRPTFLAECVGQLADEVKPLLVGTSYSVLH